jgi:hypothetical protein
MALPDDDDTSEGAGAGALSGSKATDAKKKHRDNMIYIGVALVGVILTFLIYRSNKAAQSASTTATTNPVSTAGLLAGGSGTTNATDPYADAGINQLTQQGQAQTQALSGLTSLLQTLQSEVGQMQASPPAATPAAQTPPATPGYGYINVAGIGQSVILGNVGPGKQFTGYNVAGGAPVYFGNASNVAQGSAAEVPGSIAYTPVAYASLVGSSPTTETLP